jgi:polyisoprenoid-binding protein YceI
MKKLRLILIIFFLAPNGLAFGQTIISNLAQSQIEIKGTSSLHDWESNVTEFEFSVTQEGSLFKALNGTIKVESIKSGKSIMDDKTYEALDTDNFQKISITGDEFSLSNGKLTGKVNVTIKNTTKEYDITASSTLSSGNIKIAGEVVLDMTEYGVEPPTAMFGSLTTGKVVTIDYNITFTEK